MAPGFPVIVNNVKFWTIEALYQCCRFPDAPEVQKLIVSQRSPMTAKMKSKKYRHEKTRPDWDSIRVRVMRWCLRVKLAQNPDTFGQILLAIGDRPIVEESIKDQFWGAKPEPGDALKGTNVLGRLLMELRDQVRLSPKDLQQISPPQIPNFLLFGLPIEIVTARAVSSNSPAIDGAAHQKHPPQRVKISGSLGQTDWENLLHLLAGSKVSPERVSLDIELLLSSDEDDSSKIRMLAELAQRLGIHLKVL
jgi:type I restriction enzyme S subunit